MGRQNSIKAYLIVAIFFFSAGEAAANKSSVAINVPAQADQAGKTVVQFTVTHSGNNFLHHTQWLSVSADGKEIARWDFSWNNKPESAVFTREVSVAVTAPMTIQAEASCNIHGSKGPAKTVLQPAGKAK